MNPLPFYTITNYFFMSKITHAEVRMYKMGTGDCFAIKFFADEIIKFKMMIDAGTWVGSKKKLTPHVENLKAYLDNAVDVLIVTHEHKDHVHAFDVCKHLFTDGKFNVGEIWLGWSEKEGAPEVEKWKEEYGEKKKILGIAAKKLENVIASEAYKEQFSGSKYADRAMGARQVFSEVVKDFAGLHLSADKNKVYKGGLDGMEVIKKNITKKAIKYRHPGEVITDFNTVDGKVVDGIRIYVLGPPELYDDVKKQVGGKGESYKHNKELQESGAFGAAILSLDKNGLNQSSLFPFEEHYIGSTTLGHDVKLEYDKQKWRNIDFDWLFSSGSFALRMNSLTNNLSLAIAIEFEESGRVMLFPGDAEFGSWSSWHQIKWNVDRTNQPESAEAREQKHLTEELLNRTVFYKVAHHLSHNGTAQRLGLEMMKHKDLAAMATLDYNVIHAGWKSTMPNRAIIKELLARTKGRLMIMNEEQIFFDFNDQVPIKTKILEARAMMSSKEEQEFENNFRTDEDEGLYIQYTVKA